MNYPDQFISPPFSGGAAGDFWPENQNPDLSSQFDRSQSTMNPRTNHQSNVNKGTSHIFFKTRICAKFMEGTCQNGNNCSFAHGPHDLREPPPNWQDLIREKDRSVGNGGYGGDDQRSIHRMKICKKYYNGEECPYGEKCNFLHERPFQPPLKKFKADYPFEQRESSAISIGLTGDNKGSDFDQSFCRKTKLCSKWEMGQCPFGERCNFAHGQSDLRISGSFNEADVVINTGAIPRKSISLSAFNTPPANLVIGAPLHAADEEQKKASKWKLTKKINRIYADWLDDLTPPHCSPSREEM